MTGRDWPGRLRRREVLKAAGGSSVALAGFTAATTSVTADGLSWHYETDGPVDSSPTVVSGGTHYFGSDDNNVYALLPNGHPHWDEPFETGGAVFSSPNVIGDDSDGTVYVGSDDGNVYAIDAEAGTEEWHFETFDSVASSPTVVDGTVYVGSDDGNVYALDAETGDPVWDDPFEAAGVVQTSPTVVDGTVFFGAWDDAVYGVDAQTGDLAWDDPFEQPFEKNNAIVSSPTVADGTVFFGAYDQNIYALDADTGDPAWDTPVHTDMIVQSTPTVADGTVYIGSLDGTLRALDTETGDPVWDHPFETEPLASSPTVVDDTVFIVTDNVYGISVETGEEVWRYDKNDDTTPFSSPTVYAGILFYGDEDGLYAVETPVSTASEGTRVTLGTLGHTDAWAQKETPAIPEAFLDHRETKLGGDQPALAHRIDNLSIQSVDDVDRMTTLFDALETAMTNDEISGAAGVEAAQRLVYAEEVLERWLEGASDATYPDPEHPDVNLAETTAVSLVRAALTLLLVSMVGKKIVAKQLNLGPVAEHLLDIVLKLVKKIVGWLADHLLSSQIGATSMAIIEGKARALTDQLGNDEFDAVDELQSAVEDVVDTTTDTLGDAFQSVVGESGPDGGLTAELGSLESAFDPATIDSEGMNGSLSGAQAGRDEYLGRLDDTFVTASSLLEQFEEEYDALLMVETAMDMYHETENEALGAVLGLLGALVGVLEDVASIIKELFGGAVVGLPAMLKAGDRRALGVQSVIEGEVQ